MLISHVRYKGMKCIYKIESCSGKMYIGSSVNYYTRKHMHLWKLNNNKHHSQYLQRHVNKYGIEDLEFKILYIIQEGDNIVDYEQYLINYYQPVFNMNPIAHRPPNHTGRKLSKEHKAKIAKGNLGRINTTQFKLSQSKDSKRRKLVDSQVLEIIKLIYTMSQTEIAKLYNVDQGTISNIKNKKTYLHLWDIV